MASNQEHTVKAFDQDLTQLRGLVAQMGGLAEQAISDAMKALQQGDAALADSVVSADTRLDALEADVERQVVRVIALRAPMAVDLREVIAVLRIAAVLERVGDYAKNIARRSALAGIDRRIAPIATLAAMARLAAEMLHDVLDAFAARDAEAAARVVRADDMLDRLYDASFDALVAYMVENTDMIGNCAHLLFVAKNLERIGDHATNVGEMVYYAATGHQLDTRGAR